MHRNSLKGQPPFRHHHDPRALVWELMEHKRRRDFDGSRRRGPIEAQAGAVPRPSLWARLTARLRRKTGQAILEDADKEPSASDFSRLGPSAAASYIRRTDKAGDDSKSGEGRDIAA